MPTNAELIKYTRLVEEKCKEYAVITKKMNTMDNKHRLQRKLEARKKQTAMIARAMDEANSKQERMVNIRHRFKEKNKYMTGKLLKMTPVEEKHFKRIESIAEQAKFIDSNDLDNVIKRCILNPVNRNESISDMLDGKIE